MTFRQFLWQLIKRSFHIGLKGAEKYHLLLVIVFSFLAARTEEQWRPLYIGVASVFAFLFLVSPYWYAYKMYREALGSGVPGQAVHERDALKAQLTDVYSTCEQIFHLSGGAKAASAVLEEEVLIEIDEHGTGQITENVIYKAYNPIRYLQQRVFGDAPVSLLNLEFKARAKSGRVVRILPTRDEPKEKIFLLFFLPEVSPDDPPVACEIEWKWPQMFPQLVRRREDFWRWATKGSALVPRIRFRFKLHPKLPPIKLSNPFVGGEQIEPGKSVDEKGYREYVWEMTKVDPRNPIEIRLTPW